MVSLVRSSSVGPKPPVVMTTSLRPSASSSASRSLPGLSPTVQAKSRLTPMAESSRATNAASVLIVCPSKSSVPTEMISAFMANSVAEMSGNDFFGGKPPLEETPSKTCQRGSRHPIPLKLFPHGYNKSFRGDIGNEGPIGGHSRRSKGLWRKTGRNAVAGHPSPASILAIRTSLSCGHEPLWEGRDSTAPR